jgi:hypothetical protein
LFLDYALTEGDCERERGTGEFGVHDVPTELQIRTKLVGGELRADLEDEFFGGFSPADAKDEPERQRGPRRPRGCPKRQVPGCDWKWLEGWGWASTPQNYPSGGAMWGRVVRHAHPRQWAAVEPAKERRPYLLRELRRRTQLPPVDKPDALGPTIDPPFWRDALREEKIAQREDGQVRPQPRGRHRPSYFLEQKRFKKLPPVDVKLFPAEVVATPSTNPLERKARMRAELATLVHAYLRDGGVITRCPAETTTAMLNRGPVGRPRKAKIMTDADRAAKRRFVAKLDRLLGEGLPPDDRRQILHLRDLVRQMSHTLREVPPHERSVIGARTVDRKTASDNRAG